MMCRNCFWAALITRKEPKVWCSHKVWHGWHLEPACKGVGYQKCNRHLG